MKEELATNSRRNFLRNTAMVTLSTGLIPFVGKANALIPSNSQIDCNETTLDLYGQGPFYTADAPVIGDNQLANENEAGTRLIITGVVKTLDCLQVIPNTLIDIWHANDAGAYDNTGYNLRGRTYSNAQGYYVFETILPGKYLNGASFRPRHIHFKITPPEFPTLITQLYFEGDTDIPGDAAASVTTGNFDATSRIIPIALNSEGKYEGTWDIVLDGDGITGVQDIHLNKGIIYSASPNPFTNSVELNYGIYQESQVAIQIFDVQGSMVATLDESRLQPQKYTSLWIPEAYLPAGIYFAALKINNLHVHYVKLLRL
jgi:protocatechuate 3,4-dioxygenase beta subunit